MLATSMRRVGGVVKSTACQRVNRAALSCAASPTSSNPAPGEDLGGRFPPKRFHNPLRTKKHGIEVLNDPLWNKSLAFDMSERDRLGLRGLLPPAVRTQSDQISRTISRLRALPDDIQKNIFLQELHNRNETLYHRILIEYVDEIAPLVYTPTVGKVCQEFGVRFSRTRGMYFSVQDQGKFHTMVHNWPHDDVHVIVVTDGSRVLGLGDLGVHGMGISIGKLALYCAAGGIAPHRVLPIALDVGTNNEALLNDPNYVGTRQRRLTGQEYFDFMDEFMDAIFSRWKNVVVQFEDFETSKAVPLLEKYRDKYRCFNDDIQGTGCVTLACILSAAKIAGKDLTDLRFVSAGAGSAGLGVCSQIMDGLLAAGLTREEARKRFVVCSKFGAIGRNEGSAPHHNGELSSDRLPWINEDIVDGTPLEDVIREFKPSVLLGLTGQPNIFTENIIRDMASINDRPIIMPMSNPTSRAECTAEQAYTWSDGRAIVATGSPFPAVTLTDGKSLYPSQCNNMYIFPGLGLAASVAGIQKFTDEMLYIASVACANTTTEEDIQNGRTFPHIRHIREVSHAVAVAVIEEGIRAGLAPKIKKRHLEEGIDKLVARKMYYPKYVPLL